MLPFAKFAIPALLSLTAAGGAFAQAGFMTKADIQKSIIGKSFTSVSEKGKPMVATFTASELKLLVDGQFKATGKISYKDGDIICLSFPGGPPECDKVRKGAGGFEFVDATSGSVHNVYKPK